ncbi:MAG: hypothetical protein KDC46_01505 [Thermoleophilia bacterium]|nr:hypothetical protein [Thermoleophilia bacterium]
MSASATSSAPDAATRSASTTTVDGRITAPALVDARWLVEHRSGVTVIDTRSAAAFATGHLPGARSLPLDALLVDDSSRPAISRLAAATRAVLASRGIAPDDHVVLIDDCDGSAALGAAICELAGMRRVTVVQGSGIDSWRAIGETLTADTTEFTPVPPADWAETTDRTTTIAAFEDLVDAVVEGRARVIDTRSQLEHEGIIGAPCCAGRGAIAGSVHVEWTQLFDMFGAPRSTEYVRELLDQVGISTDDPVVVTCHAGHRAAIAARVLRSVGMRDVRVSLGSWHEWSLRGLGEDVDEG